MGIGRHLLADLYGVPPDRIHDAALMRMCLETAARRAGLTPLAPAIVHCFEGGGMTGFLMLSESHIAFHTYPEHGFIALDIFSCGSADPHVALDLFRAHLQPVTMQVTETIRGKPST